jgi:hypothetical protein
VTFTHSLDNSIPFHSSIHLTSILGADWTPPLHRLAVGAVAVVHVPPVSETRRSTDDGAANKNTNSNDGGGGGGGTRLVVTKLLLCMRPHDAINK